MEKHEIWKFIACSFTLTLLQELGAHYPQDKILPL